MAEVKANYDEPWKVTIGLYLEEFLSFFYPGVHQKINWKKKPISLDKEL